MSTEHADGDDRLRSLEASFAAVEEAMESLLRITADGGDGEVVVAQIRAVVSEERFPLAATAEPDGTGPGGPDGTGPAEPAPEPADPAG